jgi:cysteine synthase
MPATSQTSCNRYPAALAPTPLVPVALEGGPGIWCKLDFLQPSGSTKDRMARYILEKAMREGRVKAGDTVAEASSGSTSIAMSLTCAQLGLRFIAVMPEGVSSERVLMIRAYGGATTLTPKEQGLRGALAEVERLGREEHAFLPRQFANPDNAEAHRCGTAREILEQIPDRRLDAVVSGVGTGGTLVGLYEGCLDAGLNPLAVLAKPINVVRVAEEECCSFSARIPGVVDCVSEIFRPERFASLEILEVDDTEAIETTKEYPPRLPRGSEFRSQLPRRRTDSLETARRCADRDGLSG